MRLAPDYDALDVANKVRCIDPSNLCAVIILTLFTRSASFDELQNCCVQFIIVKPIHKTNV